MGQPERVLIVGGGIAGLGAALRLAEAGVAVELVERRQELGGACRSVEVPSPVGPRRIDVGVCDFNRDTFRALDGLLGTLGAPLVPVCQDASYRWADGRSVSHELLHPEIRRFSEEANLLNDEVTAGSWLAARGFSEAFLTRWFAPRAAGCFPSPDVDARELPLRSLVRFWRMHGIVGDRPARRVCIVGGMHRYVPAVRRRLERAGVHIHLGETALGVQRGPAGVRLRTSQGTHHADALVLATWPHVALRLIEPTDAERSVLSSCATQPGRVVVHTDPRLMPQDRRHWAAYNYVASEPHARVPGPTITFWPDRLGNRRSTPTETPVFVTLNPHIEPASILYETTFVHPVFGRADALHNRLAALQGQQRTWFCGSWVAEPYLHETALQSGLDTAQMILQASERSGLL